MARQPYRPEENLHLGGWRFNGIDEATFVARPVLTGPCVTISSRGQRWGNRESHRQ